MDSQKIESTKIAAADDPGTANNLLHCAYSTLPVEQRGTRTYGPWDVTKVYEGDKSADDWLAERIVNRQSGPESYWAKLNGVTYDDIIQSKDSGHPGEDTVFEYRSDGQPMKEFAKGTPEYEAVTDLVHNRINFDSCGSKE